MCLFKLHNFCVILDYSKAYLSLKVVFIFQFKIIRRFFSRQRKTFCINIILKNFFDISTFSFIKVSKGLSRYNVWWLLSRRKQCNSPSLPHTYIHAIYTKRLNLVHSFKGKVQLVGINLSYSIGIKRYMLDLFNGPL